MNVYTRRPNPLQGAAFHALKDCSNNNGDFQQRKKRQSREEVCFEVGYSLMPAKMEEDAMKADNDSVGLKSKVKIPAVFQGGSTTDKGGEEKKCYNGNSNCSEKNEVSRMAGNVLANGEKRASKSDNEDMTNRGGVREEASFRVKKDINRPSSKLIDDKNDLGKLFNTLHGKEVEVATQRSIGKLRMSGVFEAKKDEVKDWGKVKETGQGSENKGIENAIEIPYSDWKKGNDQVNRDAGNIYEATGKGKDGTIVTKSDVTGKESIKTGSDMRYNGWSAGNVDMTNRIVVGNKTTMNNDSKEELATKNNAWMLMQTDSQILSPQKYSKNQNHEPASEKVDEQMNQSTSHSRMTTSINDLRRKTETVDEQHNNSAKQCNKQKFKINQMNNGPVKEMDSGEQVQNRTERDVKIGKLIMPATFSNANRNAGEKRRLLNANQPGKIKIGKSFELSKDALANGNAVKMQAKTKTGQEIDSGSGASTGSGQKTGIGSNSSEDTKVTLTSNQIITAGNWEPLKTNQALQPLSSKQPVKVGKLKFNSDGLVAKQNDVQTGLIGPDDNSVDETALSDEKPQKQIGRLNIHSIFSNDDRKKENKNVKEKEDDSEFSKNKAIFNQAEKKSKEKSEKVGKLRLNSSKSDRDEELASLSPEGELPSTISTEMKDQLEKILQQRSVSSLSSLNSSTSSKNYDDGSRSASRQSITSLSSSTGSQGLKVSSSSDSNLLKYMNAEANKDNESEEDGSSKKINNGSLKLQLDGIFQARLSEGSPSPVNTSLANSLDVSMNSENFPSFGESDLSARKSSLEDDQKEKRKLIADALKRRYGRNGDNGVDVDEDDKKELHGEKATIGKVAYDQKEVGVEEDGISTAMKHDNEARKDIVMQNTSNNMMNSEETASGIQAKAEERCSNGIEKDNKNYNGNTVGLNKNAFELKSSKVVAESAEKQESGTDAGKKRGRVSIPGVFAGKPNTASEMPVRREGRSETKRSELKRESVSMEETSNNEDKSKGSIAGDVEPEEEKQRNIKKLNIPTSFMTNIAESNVEANLKTADRSGEKNYNKDKGISFQIVDGKDKQFESNQVMEFEKEKVGKSVGKRINVMDNASRNVEENGVEEQTRRKPAGKLSASMFQVFLNEESQKETRKIGGNRSGKKTDADSRNKSSEATEDIGKQSFVRKEDASEKESSKGKQDATQDVTSVPFQVGIDAEKLQDGQATNQLDLNNNEVMQRERSEIEDESKWQHGNISSKDATINLNATQKPVSRKTVGRLSIPMAFQ
eukprot:gene8230-9111_t